VKTDRTRKTVSRTYTGFITWTKDNTMNYHARILTACAAAFAISATTTMAATVTVNVHPASAAQISSDAALANATIIDLLVDSQGDDLLSFDLVLTTTGTIYNHPLENPNDAAPNPAAVLSFPALGATWRQSLQPQRRFPAVRRRAAAFRRAQRAGRACHRVE
jgi:hypothetical protein